jgi:hypothetical protein
MVWVTAVKTAADVVFTECCPCGAEGEFGYQTDQGMRWYCAEHRLGQWFADARVTPNSTSPNLRASVVPKVADGSPPDLQALVAEHGAYHFIPSEAWAEFDRAMEAWQEQRRDKFRRR